MFRFALAATLAALSLAPIPARASAGPAQPAAPANRPVPAAQLANQVSTIANSRTISSSKKERQISTAVRTAVVADTAYQKNPEETVRIALELAAAAARAAPRHVEVIVNAITFAPSIARIDGAAGRVRSAAAAAAKDEISAPATAVASGAVTAPAARTQESPSAPPPRAAGTSNTVAVAPAPISAGGTIPVVPGSDAIRLLEGPASSPNGLLGRSATFGLTLDAGARYDDNIYLNSTNKVGATVMSLTPGAALEFGDATRLHGALGYKLAFTRYQRRVSPNTSLSTASGSAGYDGATVTFNAGGSFQQVNQNSGDTVTLGQQAVIRRDVIGANAGAEVEITPKTSARVGTVFSRTEYKSTGLIGSTSTDFPLNLYFHMTPKLDLSAGYTYTRVKPQLDGPNGRNTYSNLGLRGELTPKLSGTFSAGYRTQTVAANPASHILGFDGSFGYLATTKTNLTLSLSRDFTTGALGESQKNSSYGLSLSNSPSLQWKFAAGLNHRRVAYGSAVFSKTAPTFSSTRKDRLWSGNLAATYLFSRFLSVSAEFASSRNRSSITGADYSDNVTNVNLGLRY